MPNKSTSHSISRPENAAAATFPGAPRPGQWLPTGPKMFWLALPLALIAGCASEPSRIAANDASDTPVAVPLNPPVTQRDRANVAVGNEMFYLFLSLTNADLNLSAVAYDGGVTLGGSSIAGSGRQDLVDQVWALPGVTQVADAKGNDLTKTAGVKTVGER